MKWITAALALEKSLGDPRRHGGGSPRSPLSFASSLDADEREAFPVEACEVLREASYFEHFIPSTIANGAGKLARLDELLMLGRVVARRDLTVAIATGQTLLGALPVWLDGSDAQRARVADLVRRGKLGCLALTEEAHGSDIAASEVALTTTSASGGARELSGEKWCINNATRGAFMTALARTENDHAIVLVDKEKLPTGSFENLPRLRTHGVRGADISGIRFSKTPGVETVGRESGGLGLVFRTLQLSRTACAAFSLGAGDTALRLAYAFASERKLYGKTAYEIPIVRQALANAFADLLAAEALTLVACRVASLAPEELSVTSAIVKALVPALVDDVIREAGVVLGARGYLRDGDAAVFQKIVRDHAVVSLFDGSTAVNLAVLANQLPKLADARAATATATATSPPSIREGLFDLEAELGPTFWKLRATARGSDSLVGAIPALAQASAGCPEESLARALAKHLEDFDHAVRAHAGANERSSLNDDPRSMAFAKRYCLLAAGAACLGLLSSSRAKHGELLTPTLARVLDRLAPEDGNETAPPALAALTQALETACAKNQLLSLVPFALS